MKNKQKEWHHATKPLKKKVFIFILVNLYFALHRFCIILLLRCFKISFFLIYLKTFKILVLLCKKPFSNSYISHKSILCMDKSSLVP
jgi:hypothetical protein